MEILGCDVLNYLFVCLFVNIFDNTIFASIDWLFDVEI